MEVPVGMKEVFSSPDEADKEDTCYQLLKEYIIYVNQQDISGKSLSMK